MSQLEERAGPAEGMDGGNYQHGGKPEGPGIWTRGRIKTLGSGELQQVLEPDLEQNLTLPTRPPHKRAVSGGGSGVHGYCHPLLNPQWHCFRLMY